MTAQDYRQLIENYLLSCQHIEIKPRFPVNLEIYEGELQTTLYWSDKIDLKRNLLLTVMEHATFDEDEMLERSFSYDLREKGAGGRLIWRIDNHCRLQPVNARCHVHILPDDPPNSRLECFPDSTKIDFTYAVHCIKIHFEEKPQKWEEGQHVEVL